METADGLMQWQAASHPKLSACELNELFAPTFAERYRVLHCDIWERMVQLHGTIRTLETLAEFPFEFLYGPNHMEFWRLVVTNFAEAVIVLLHGLINDKGRDAHTITRFKDELLEPLWQWRDSRMKDLYRQTLRDRSFDKDAKALAEHVRKIRSYRIAHRLIDWQTGHAKEQLQPLSFKELRRLFDAAHSLFGALCFGGAYLTLAGDLIPVARPGQETSNSVESVLKAVVRDNPGLREPESDPWWPERRKYMPPEELRKLNWCRRFAGLSDV